MKKYEKYKDSRIEWLGVIPEHWKITKLKHLAQVRTGYTPPKDNDENYNEEGVVWVKPDNLNEFIPIVDSKEKISKSGLRGNGLIPKGSVLVCCIGSIGKFGIAGVDLITNQQINSLIFNDKIDKQYGKFLIASSVSEHDKHSNGNVVKILNGENQKNIFFVLPPMPEQTSIASYLDHKTTQIDTVIGKKEQLIEKLKCQRQAIINEAVTKGLNPDASIKDSGIEWLGEIPEHWKIKDAKYLLAEKDGIKIGPFGSALKLDTLSESGIKIYGQGNVIKDDFTLGERYLTYEQFEADFKQYEILDGDILITMMGTTGKSKVFSKSFERGILDSHLLRLRFNEVKFRGNLFSIILEQSDYISQQVIMKSRGSIMAGLNSSIIKELKIIVPPIEEQDSILKYIETISSQLDSILNKVELTIEKLKLYRQSIISEAVTGKIDLRDWEQSTNN